MILIACVDQNWGIGKDNQLLFSIKEDMQWFRNVTMNHTVVMGMNTLKSLPNGKPLPNRTNIVLTRSDIVSDDPSLIYINSIEELLDKIDEINDLCFCIGGESIYRQLLPYCKAAFITFVNKSKDADAYLPNLSNDDRFQFFERKLLENEAYPGLVETRLYFNKTYHPTII